MQVRLQDALNGMDPLDREVLALCHFEELSNDEAAAVLGIDRASAGQHYVRALKRLNEILRSIPGLLTRP
jgi:RNA polymerase sigma-70 factor (ECF subfamily)